MPAASSDDARGASPAASVLAPSEGETEDPHISAYVAHLAHVGDEMAPGLGALFADAFPAVPALADIHEDFTFSKNDSLLLFAGLDGNALTLAQVIPLSWLTVAPWWKFFNFRHWCSSQVRPRWELGLFYINPAVFCTKVPKYLVEPATVYLYDYTYFGYKIRPYLALR